MLCISLACFLVPSHGLWTIMESIRLVGCCVWFGICVFVMTHTHLLIVSTLIYTWVIDCHGRLWQYLNYLITFQYFATIGYIVYSVITYQVETFNKMFNSLKKNKHKFIAYDRTQIHYYLEDKEVRILTCISINFF